MRGHVMLRSNRSSRASLPSRSARTGSAMIAARAAPVLWPQVRSPVPVAPWRTTSSRPPESVVVTIGFAAWNASIVT